MDAKLVFTGTIIWALGMFIPTLHHGMLSLAAIHSKSHAYDYHSLVKYFFNLPSIVWIYVIAMWLVGAVVVIAGLRGKASAE